MLPLAARGYSHDGKRGSLQIEYGLLTDRGGRPVAVRVFAVNTGRARPLSSRPWRWYGKNSG